MEDYEISQAMKTINAQLDYALKKEKETADNSDTVIWHMVASDYRNAIKALKEVMEYQSIGTVSEFRELKGMHVSAQSALQQGK